jgi:hypothetical protein
MTKLPIYFAIVPDGDREPIALFRDLDEAMVWALGTLGSDRFVIRKIALARDATAAATVSRPV